ncbi:MAG TPA: protein translocase subunit SecF [Candidatus Aenigmarchaeota archaeon]|nr:protein translocase subunit SecF [Candidatus Aenigmarchaeota archaeon]
MNLYEKIGYKKLTVIPLIFLALCLGFLFYHYQQTGEFFSKSIDLRGGAQLTIDTNRQVDASDLEAYLKAKFGDVRVRTTVGINGNSVLIRVDEHVDKEKLLEEIEKYGLDTSHHSFEKIGASLGKSFFAQSTTALVVAFIFMGLVVFVIFRNFVPSIAVIWCAFSDIVCTIAVMQMLDMPLSLASFAGLLLVLGYSIDTDILLTTRVIKRREGNIKERCKNAFKTGITMTLTSLVAFTSLYLVSGATALREIATVLIIALLIDVPNTWLTNLGILRWWAEKRGIK